MTIRHEFDCCHGRCRAGLDLIRDPLEGCEEPLKKLQRIRIEVGSGWSEFKKKILLALVDVVRISLNSLWTTAK